MAITVTGTTTHTKTLVSPSTGSADRVYGADYVSATSHTTTVAFAGLTANALLLSDGTDLTQSANLTFDGTNLYVAGIDDSNGNLLLSFVTTASAVNYFTLTNSATGSAGSNGVKLATTGSDATVDMIFDTKGAASRYQWKINDVLKMDFTDIGGGVFGLRNSGGPITAGTVTIGSATNNIGFNNDGFLSRLAAGIIGVGTSGGGSTGTIRSKYQSSDGTVGVSGTGSTITCKDGIITAIS